MLLSRATCTALHVAELSLASKLCPRHVCWCRWAHLPRDEYTFGSSKGHMHCPASGIH